MTNKQAIKILQEEKSWEYDDRKIDAFNSGIDAIKIVDYMLNNRRRYYDEILDMMDMDR